MARDTFQPILSGPSVGSVPQNVVEGVDVRGAASLLGSLADNAAKQRKENTEIQTAADLAVLQGGLLDMHTRREEATVSEQNFLSNLTQLQDDNIPDADQAAEFGRIQSELEKLKAFRRQNIGSDTIFNARRNDLMKRALFANPLLSEKITTLFGADLADSKSSAGSKDEANFISSMDERFGRGTWGPSEVKQWKEEKAIIDAYKNRSELGIHATANLEREMGVLVPTMMSGWLDKTVQRLGPGGILGVQEMTEAQNELMMSKMVAEEELNNRIHMAMLDGKPLTDEHISKLRSRLADKFKSYEDLLDGKDFLTRANYLRDARKAIYMEGAPDLLIHLDAISGELGAAGALQDLQVVFNNPSVKNTVQDISSPWLEFADKSAPQAIAEAFNYLISGKTIADPGLQDIANTVAAAAVANSPNAHPKAKEAVVEAITAPMREDVSEYISGNLVETVELLNNRAFTSNLMQDLHPSSVARLNNYFTNNLSSLSGQYKEYLRQTAPLSGTFSDIEYDQSRGLFVYDLKGGNPSAAQTAIGLTNTLNSLLQASDNENLKGVVVTRENIVKTFRKTKTEFEKEKREAEAREEQERKREEEVKRREEERKSAFQ